MHFTVTGHCCLDLVIRNSMDENGEDAWADSSPMEARAGGATANVGRALASIGVDVSLYCALAEDGIGSATSLLLEQSQFATLHIERVPATGSYSLVIDSPGMDRTFRHHIGANRYFDPAKVEVRETTWLHFGYPSLTPSVLLEDGLPLKSLFERAQSAGARTSLDLAAVPSSMRDTHQKWRQFFRNVLPATDVFAPSWEDLTAVGFDTGQFTTQNVRRVGGEILAMGGSTVLVTAGSRGSALLSASEPQPRFSKPTVPGPVTQTNGAGDTFKAYFIYELGRGSTPNEAQDAATERIPDFLSPHDRSVNG